jgi:NAD(P)-dependent dehydrogenase (short-subunit alcohol dehydrogenase family)
MGQSLGSEAQGRPAFITGGAGGIGKEVARRCIELGMSPVCICDQDAAALQEAADDIGPIFLGQEIEIFFADISDIKENERLAQEVFERFGDLAFLFLNAGITTTRVGFDALWKTKPEDYHRVIDVDMHGVWYGLRAFVPRMISGGRKGIVLGTASVAGLMNTSDMTNFSYQLAKHGVVLMMEALHGSFTQDHPQLQAAVLCPFVTKTDIMANALALDRKEKPVAAAMPSSDSAGIDISVPIEVRPQVAVRNRER